MLKNKFIKRTAVVLSLAFLTLFGVQTYYGSVIPDNFYLEKGKRLELSSYPFIKESQALTVSASAQTYPMTEEVSLTLFGILPIKNVEIRCAEAPTLTVGGTPFGIKLLMEGVMVINLGSIEDSGTRICPAADCGIEKGDIIKSVDGIPVSSNRQIQSIIAESGGEAVEVMLNRNGNEFTTRLQPAYSLTNKTYCAGMWVRDSIAGIGTVTFIDSATGKFAGLGHPVCDSDTGGIIPISAGHAVPVEINDVVKGQSGIPGELQGRFTSSEPMGNLSLNNKCGIFGDLTVDALTLYQSRDYKMGFKQEIVAGPATIFTTISGGIPKEYKIEIESVEYNSGDNTKNMVIKVTDKDLLEKTGGIVQGMSGSPIIQNGKLIGAVTHVFVSDSSRGYGIFAETMYDYIK